MGREGWLASWIILPSTHYAAREKGKHSSGRDTASSLCGGGFLAIRMNRRIKCSTCENESFKSLCLHILLSLLKTCFSLSQTMPFSTICLRKKAIYCSCICLFLFFFFLQLIFLNLRTHYERPNHYSKRTSPVNLHTCDFNRCRYVNKD